MNKMIILGGGQLSVEECGITFECINNVILLTTTYGNIEMNADEFKNIVGAFIDIYQIKFYKSSIRIEMKNSEMKEQRIS